jgi:hypothetical protein
MSAVESKINVTTLQSGPNRTVCCRRDVLYVKNTQSLPEILDNDQQTSLTTVNLEQYKELPSDTVWQISGRPSFRNNNRKDEMISGSNARFN